MNIIQGISNFHTQLSRKWLIAESVSLVIVIGILDYVTGYEVSFFPFYSIPILLIVWFMNTNFALAISALCAVTWWYVDMVSGHPYTNEWLRIWDTVVRLMFFCLIVATGWGFRRQRDANRARIELLERSHQLEQEIISISERERQSIGRDLHDDLGQFLVAIGFAANALKKNLAQKLPESAPAAERIADQLNSAVIRTRNLARGILPVDQNEAGLELALEQLAFSASLLTGIACSSICVGEVVVKDNSHALHLYRIAQEALNNAVKHSGAKAIVIALEADEDSLALRISDDGTGFDAKHPESNGMGLNIMQYRARSIGGALEILPNSPTGTVVVCTIDRVGDTSQS